MYHNDHLLVPLFFHYTKMIFLKRAFFDTTLFADDTYLTLLDKSLVNLETKVNNKLKPIDSWLKNNKLSLNYSKTCHMITNKSLYNSCTILLNSFPLKHKQAVKYLGVYIDETLKWTKHIHELSSQLARYARSFYRIRNLVPRETLGMLYHSLIYSTLHYGILMCGNAAETH